jgi:hypothetical protein
VVHLGQQGAPAAVQALDHREIPQGPAPVELGGVDRGRQFEELAAVAGRRQDEVVEVVVDVEGGIRFPPGRGEAERCRRHAEPEGGDGVDRLEHASAEALAVGPLVEEGDAHERRPQRGRAIQGPHDGLGIAEMPAGVGVAHALMSI